MSETRAFAAQSLLFKPNNAASSAINCVLNRIIGPSGGRVIDIANQTIPPVDSCCQSQNATARHIANQAPATIGAVMAARPVFHEELGLFFKELREARGWESQRQAATIAKNRKVAGVSYQVLQRLESGRTKNPEPALLRALAVLYEQPYESLVRRWVAHRFGLESSDLIRHGEAATMRPSKGRPNGSIDAGVLERLTTELRDEEKALREMRKLVGELGATTTRRAESLAAVLKATPRRGGR